MASCDPFEVHFKGSAQELYDKIAALMKEHGGTISGGPTGGSFSIKITPFKAIEGTYSVAGQTCTITITQKGLFPTCSQIESFIKSHIPTVEATAIADF